MTIQQWPNEQAANRQLLYNYSINPKDELRRLLEACPSGLPASFIESVEWIAQQGDEISELERRMSDISKELELAEFPESVSLLMVLACAETLAKAPSLQTWQNVRNLTYHSWQLELWLFDIMMVCVEEKSGTKDSYIKLAKEIFERLDSFQLTSLSDSHNKEREQFRDAWNESSDKLEEIWWGLRWSSSMNYEEEFPLFKVLATLDVDEFLATVSQSRNPYLVNSVILAGGAFSKFSFWEKLAALAPTAFTVEGTWNASVMMPLLLVGARNQLLQAGHQISHFDTSDADVKNVMQEIADLTEAVIVILNKRQDALPLFARWSTWLMRQLLMKGIKDANNVHSSAVVDAALINAIGRKLKVRDVNPEPNPPSDAPAWEAWCYQAVLALQAHSGFIPTPDCKSFLNEWVLNLDDWAGKRGKQLRERANLIVTMTKDIPGDAVRFLAYPVAMSDSPVNFWIALWNDTHPLREIVEFGDADTLGDGDYKARGEAGQLLLLVFCIGLAILDQRVTQCASSHSHNEKDSVKLHAALALAVREMREIDDTLNREQWLQAVRNLAVRRLIWEHSATMGEKSGQPSVFSPADKPTFSDYLSAAKNDVMELLAVLQMTLLNESDQVIVLDKLHAASINLPKTIAIAKQLNAISPRKYPFDEVQFKLLSELATKHSVVKGDI